MNVGTGATQIGTAAMNISGTTVTIPLTTASAGTSSGALVVAGGLGVGGSLYGQAIRLTAGAAGGLTTSGTQNTTYVSTSAAKVWPLVNLLYLLVSAGRMRWRSAD